MVTAEEYTDAVADCVGYCVGCRNFTRPDTDTEDADQDCPVCEQYIVVGAERAWTEKIITVGADNE